ncbi:MAG TPA: hypothetical protein ENN47_10715 [Mesotoga infera]|uniref:Uncharacterized protein n=1 Tax=Mesotoga infera TaxID=1236046 RepID=A0A7C1CXE5_9BACT|nr:hypothetical protein [Mesotoga infera]
MQQVGMCLSRMYKLDQKDSLMRMANPNSFHCSIRVAHFLWINLR